jgi:selenide,water dikinase
MGKAMRDLEKRKRVMMRSMQLGHCICDPKKACPCDTLREKDLCPCAGEHAEQSGPLPLTSLVERPGCASKIDQATLHRVLEGLPSPVDPRVLVGMAAGDDAGVYRLDDHTALVQTVDVFSPSVDDPYMFGQIAAANSVSDVYAMGGRPITALSIIGFPARVLPDAMMREILRGGIDKMTEAGVSVIGGHSINDQEIKAGFAVTGLIDPGRIISNAGAQPGDRLILTKPLGTGILAFAAQIGRAPDGALDAMARGMAQLNRRASELMLQFGAHACTDVTGFGLTGHLAAMARAAKNDIEIVWDDLPLLPGVLQCLADGIIPGAVERNRESSAHALIADGVQPPMTEICFDAQTSGGLLIAVPETSAEAFLRRLHDEGIAEAAMVGRVLTRGEGRIVLRSDGRRTLPPPRTTRAAAARQAGADQAAPAQETNAMCCCGDGHGSSQPAADAPAGISPIQAKYLEFLQAANAPGALDAHTKQAIALALSVLSRCEPCLKSHIKKARDMGFSQDEIDEAAWMGISFGGSPTMMFYNALKRN